MGSEQFLQIGTLIAGRYEVMKCLGAGSMGLVYACRDLELSGRIVAVKVLFPEIDQDKVAAQRFRNEVFAAYDVSHPNVVRAYEFIKDGEMVAYTMEYVSGGDLASKLASQKLIPIPEIISILSQMCLGVQAIHDAQIIHRDLKPENIMLTKDGVVKIADFGIARLGHGSKLTEHGGVVGTIDYVSPEYMLNSQVDWRSDIYAMGILAYEMVAGVAPFRGDSVYATMTKRLKSDPDPISKYRPNCPPELERIVLHAMARDPEKRFQSAYEMYEELQTLGGDSITHHAHHTPHPKVGNEQIKNIKEYVGRVSDENTIVDTQLVASRKEAVARAKNKIRDSVEVKTVADSIIPKWSDDPSEGDVVNDKIEEVEIADLYQDSSSAMAIMECVNVFDNVVEDDSATCIAGFDVDEFNSARRNSDISQSSISLSEVQKNLSESDKKKQKEFNILTLKVLGIIVGACAVLIAIIVGISFLGDVSMEDDSDNDAYDIGEF